MNERKFNSTKLYKLVKLIVIVVAVIAVATLYLIEKFNFPVTYNVCGLGYQDCNVVAKFDNRDSCEMVLEREGWLCDRADKNNITCKDNMSFISTAYCD